MPWADRLTGADGLDFDEVARLHAALPSNVPIIIQDTKPDEVEPVRDLLLAATRGSSSDERPEQAGTDLPS